MPENLSYDEKDPESGLTVEDSDAFETVPNTLKASVRLKNLSKVI